MQRKLVDKAIKASRRLRGSIVRRGLMYVPPTTWLAFEIAMDNLHRFHAAKNKARSIRRAATSTRIQKGNT